MIGFFNSILFRCIIWFMIMTQFMYFPSTKQYCPAISSVCTINFVFCHKNNAWRRACVSWKVFLLQIFIQLHESINECSIKIMLLKLFLISQNLNKVLFCVLGDLLTSMTIKNSENHSLFIRIWYFDLFA